MAEYEKAVEHNKLRYALAIMSGRIVAPTVTTCKVLGFTDSDMREANMLGQMQPPHIEVVRERCEQIVYDAIMACKNE